VEALVEGQQAALTQKAIDLALAGDGPALRLCLDRIAPPRKDSPVSFDLPPISTAADTITASSSLLAALAAGEVTRDEAARVIALLIAHRGAGGNRRPGTSYRSAGGEKMRGLSTRLGRLEARYSPRTPCWQRCQTRNLRLESPRHRLN
jgi:hypothetical protein